MPGNEHRRRIAASRNAALPTSHLFDSCSDIHINFWGYTESTPLKVAGPDLAQLWQDMVVVDTAGGECPAAL